MSRFENISNFINYWPIHPLRFRLHNSVPQQIYEQISKKKLLFLPVMLRRNYGKTLFFLGMMLTLKSNSELTKF